MRTSPDQGELGYKKGLMMELGASKGGYPEKKKALHRGTKGLKGVEKLRG